MNEGLLWFDADPKRSLKEKIVRAATRYRDKFRAVPNRCYVNASQLDGPWQLGVLLVEPRREVLRHHFLIGVDDES